MAKKQREKLGPVDLLPNYSQQPRSTTCPKRRTDFSPFFCSNLESPSRKEVLSSVSNACLNEAKKTSSDIWNLPLVRFTKSQEKERQLLTNCVEVPVMEADSVAENAPSGPWINRHDVEKGSDFAMTPEFTPIKSQNSESSDVCLTPGSVVWAKTPRQLWWPAEISRERSTSPGRSAQVTKGRVLVQYYGNNEIAWVDPTKDLSEFENCFEERSCNATEEFQEALKQALHWKEHLSSCKQLFDSPDGPHCSIRDESSEKGNSSGSSKTRSDYFGRERNKRERRPKVHFDEVPSLVQSARRVRRFRIMRYLGLAAPTGSPFSGTSNNKDQLWKAEGRLVYTRPRIDEDTEQHVAAFSSIAHLLALMKGL